VGERSDIQVTEERRDNRKVMWMALIGVLLFSLMYLALWSRSASPVSLLEVATLLVVLWIGVGVYAYLVVQDHLPLKRVIGLVYWLIALVSAAILQLNTSTFAMALAYLAVLQFAAFRLPWRTFGVACFSVVCAFTGVSLMGNWEDTLQAQRYSRQDELLFSLAFVITVVCALLSARLVASLQISLRRSRLELKHLRESKETLADGSDLGLLGPVLFRHSVVREFALVAREQLPFSIAVIRVDEMAVASLHSPSAGWPRLMGQFIKQELRAVDLVAFYGDREYSVILHGVNLIAAEQVLARLMANLASAEVASQNGWTLSVGVTQYRIGDDTDDLIDRAGELAAAAAEQGGNQLMSDMEAFESSQ
jgi:GGDEF domain-containing protein